MRSKPRTRKQRSCSRKVVASLADGQKRKAELALELGVKREDRTLARAGRSRRA